jgi:hypothetical protein
MRYNVLNFILFASLLLSLSLSGYGQGTVEEFGKNRVQFSDDFKNWNKYESQNFITYYYGKARNIADVVVQIAEANNDDIRRILEYRFNEKIDIIVYANITDFKQSNIGNDDVFRSQAGETTIVGNKMFVYFTGDHLRLKRQIREGIARVYLEQMQVGTSIQEFVQNAVNSDLPAWYFKGMVSFVGSKWNAGIDNKLRQLLNSGEFEEFYGLARDYPIAAGHMFWYHVQETYGEDAIANLLYLNRINRKLENTFLYSLGTPLERIIEEAFQSFLERYQKERANLEELPFEDRVPLKNRRQLPYSQIAMHPNGNKFAYVTNEIGQYKLYIGNKKEGKVDKILKRSFRNPFQVTDYDNPLIAWNTRGDVLGMIYEKRDKRYFQWWNFRTDEEGKVKLDPRFEKVYSFDFFNDNNLVMSASEMGYVDIYLFNLRRRSSERLTHDYFDDHDVKTAKIQGRKGILFSSNRTNTRLSIQRRDTSLPNDTYDLYFLDISEDAERMDRLTNTPSISEHQAHIAGDGELVYTGLHLGFRRLLKGEVLEQIDTIGRVVNLSTGRKIYLSEGKRLLRIDPRLVESEDPWVEDVLYLQASNLSNYPTHIANISVAEGKILFSCPYHFTHLLFQKPIARFDPQAAKASVLFNNKSGRKKPEEEASSVELEVPNAPVKEEVTQYRFQSRFDNPPGLEQKLDPKNSEQTVLLLPDLLNRNKKNEKSYVRFNGSRAIAYRLQFRFESFVANMDNQPLFGGLNTFAGTPQGYEFAPLGLLGKFTVSDLFEDYEITAGARFPTTFNGAEYFIYYDNRKKRWDKRYALYRRTLNDPQVSAQNRPSETKRTNLIGIYQLRYPFDIYRSFRLTSTLRFDTYEVLASDRASLETPPIRTQRIGLKAEYVFDNTYLMKVNMLNGTRYKFWIEGLNKFQVQFSPWEFSWSDDYMTIIGMDARHYMRVGRHAILAGRIAGASSFGSEQLLYFMGGVDNWMFAQYNDNIGIPPGGNFAFQALAGNMRGFKQNTRNGSSYVLSNIEFRVAPFNYFSKKRLQSRFLRNFQIVGFFDIGTAWFGLSPFSDENPLNTVNLGEPPIQVQVNYYRDPMILGYGGGVRMDVFGYFMRFDYAWGLETKEINDPIFYFSLGKDF